MSNKHTGGNAVTIFALPSCHSAGYVHQGRLSFAFMEAKRTFENIYLNPGQDIRDRDLRFDTSRHFMQNYYRMGLHG